MVPAAGAVLGAVIGNNVGKGGNALKGAVLGGVVVEKLGVIGNKMDKQAKEIEEAYNRAEVVVSKMKELK